MAKQDTQAIVDSHVSGQSNQPMSKPAHALTYGQVAQELSTNTLAGLDAEEAAERLIKYGKNDLGEEKGVQPLKIFIAQIANAMTLVSSRTARWRNGVLTSNRSWFWHWPPVSPSKLG